ncbi:DUF2290 domain-containing protein [Microvirga sp. HBU67558]|uniref:DUF2290 domain-containing protein n=1 Tax=Microvirga TaxID=186650 RepID=UPI001B36B2D6|nr:MULTISPECIES: DUF2290 domain-containing protein [unclassified Microvirga]MBQ0824374.1 DUF2290 domain-containing protein [Microvirga sp. HBU67558]
MNPQQVVRNIQDVMTRVIEAGLSDQQNYPAFKAVGEGRGEIYISGSPDLSFSLKDVPYPLIYDNLEKAKAYNIKMIDGSLIQMAYTFKDDIVESHRLALFPAPFLMPYESAVSAYESDQLYAEVVGRFSVKFPIRFDYASSDDEHIDIDHPKSHLTLGQYEGCRIPVDGPLTPSRFMRFVLRNFYNPAYARVDIDDLASLTSFPSTITDNERTIAHLIG